MQLNHNDRSIPPNYLLPKEAILKAGGGVEVNRTAQEALALKEHIVGKAMQDYLQHRGQKFRAKSYLWSAVVNLKPTSTMQDLEALAQHFKDKYGFQCYQIAIHRDEGHIDDEGQVHINHHAHLEFVTLDENTGKSLFRGGLQTPKALSQMQTDTASILKMDRGERKRDYIDENGNFIKGTGRKRIEPRAYGQLMEKARREHKATDGELHRRLIAIDDQRTAILNDLGKIVDTTLAWMNTNYHAICARAGIDIDSKQGMDKIHALVDAFMLLIQEHITKFKANESTLASVEQWRDVYLECLSQLQEKVLALLDLNKQDIDAKVGVESPTNDTEAFNTTVQAIISLVEEHIQTNKDTLANAEQWNKAYLDSLEQMIIETLAVVGTDYKSICAKAGLDPKYSNTDEFNARIGATISVVCNYIKELTESLRTICQTIAPQNKQLTPAQIKELVITETQRLRDLNNTQEQEHQQALEARNNTISTLTSKLAHKDELQEKLASKTRGFIKALKTENKAKSKSIDELTSNNTALQQENQELKDSNTALKSIITDLTTFPAPQGKKLTTKEVKTLASGVRKQMIAINQSLGEHKLFTQQDYMAVRALIEEGLTFESFNDAIAQIELEAKERYEKALESREQELGQEHTKELETKEKEHTRALEAKDAENAKAIDSLKEQHAIALKQAQEANEKLQQENQALEAKQQSLNQELKNSKQEITTLKATNQELQQENQALKIQNTSLEHTLEHNNNIECFTNKGLALINTHLKPLSKEVHAIIQENDEKLMSIYQQCQEEMLLQASVCVVLGEELKVGKFKAWNKVESLFEKGSKDSIPFEYVERGKVHYRELNRREQSIKKDLADTLKDHSQKLQSINDNAYNRVSKTMDDVCHTIEKLTTEFKNSAEYGTELNQAKEQINTLEYNQKKLQNQVSALEKEKEKNKQEVQEAQANKEALRKSGVETASLKKSLENTQTALEASQKALKNTKIELENTKAELKTTQSDLGSLETLRGTIYSTIHQISEINPEMAQELEIKASNVLNDLARLKEELPQALAWAKEQKQKGSGGYHK